MKDQKQKNRDGFTRRDFLRASSLGAAGALMGGFGISRSLRALADEPRPTPPSSVQATFDTWINPPPGNLLRNPALIPATRSGNIVTAALTAGPSMVQIDNGPGAELLTYNGQYPGPTIRARSGDIVRLSLTNALPTGGNNLLGHPLGHTNLHTHGWHVSPCGNSDNVFLDINPGTTFNFEFDLAKQRPSATDFYHPHVHGLVAEQMWGGLAGALIVEDGDVAPSIAPYSVPGKEYVMVLKDLSLDAQGRPAPYTHHDFQMGKEGDLVMVNGQVHPVLRMRPGEVKRLRFINASTSRYYTLSVEGHGLDPDLPDGFHVIGTDGGLLARAVRLNTPNPELEDADGNPVTSLGLSPFMTIAVAERVDMLFKATMTPGTYRVFSLPYDRGHEKRQLVTLMTVVVEGAPLDEPIPTVVNTQPETIPQAVLDNLDSFPRRTIDLTMEMDNVDHNSLRNFINGIEFKGMPPNETSFKVTSRVAPDSYEVWDVIDNSTMDHPFHIHTNDFQILKITCGNGEIDYATFYADNPEMRGAWKDTLNVGKGGMNFSILVPVTDFTGDAVFHCHILEHEDTGMMGHWIRGTSCA
jgi:FtsP/CotA-like multicopper oxidase with cupredoxin domain